MEKFQRPKKVIRRNEVQQQQSDAIDSQQMTNTVAGFKMSHPQRENCGDGRAAQTKREVIRQQFNRILPPRRDLLRHVSGDTGIGSNVQESG